MLVRSKGGRLAAALVGRLASGASKETNVGAAASAPPPTRPRSGKGSHDAAATLRVSRYAGSKLRTGVRLCGAVIMVLKQ